MFARFSVLISIAASLVWAALCVLVYFPEDFLAAPLLEPELFMRVVVIATPLLLIWSFVYAAVAEARGAERLWNLQNQIQSLRSLLTNYDQKWTQNFSPPDGGQTKAATWADPPSETFEPEPPRLQTAPAASPDKNTLEIPRSILIRAFDFADDENDVEAFEALDRAAEDPEIAEILEMAMDILQKLTAAGISVEVLPTDYARPLLWREAFAGGRSDPLVTVSGIGSAEDHRKVAFLLEDEPEFRSVAQGFVNRTVTLLGPFMEMANDQEIFEFANTRTIRACILMDSALIEE